MFNKLLFLLFQALPRPPCGAQAGPRANQDAQVHHLSRLGRRRAHLLRGQGHHCLAPVSPARCPPPVSSSSASFALTQHLAAPEPFPGVVISVACRSLPTRARAAARAGWAAVPRALPGRLEVRRRTAGEAPPSHTLHAAQGYTTHRKLGGRSGRRGPAPTTSGTPAPPAAAPPAPRAHSRVAPTPAHAPRVRGGPFGRIPGGPIFRLPLRFIGAAAVGRSSEEAGASSGW